MFVIIRSFISFQKLYKSNKYNILACSTLTEQIKITNHRRLTCQKEWSLTKRKKL